MSHLNSVNPDKCHHHARAFIVEQSIWAVDALAYTSPYLALPDLQARIGLVAAGNFGVPQGRWRCFMWAAKAGQQLPAIPKPTHNCIRFNVRGRAGG